MNYNLLKKKLLNYEKMQSDLEKCKLLAQTRDQEVQSQKRMISQLQQMNEEKMSRMSKLEKGLQAEGQSAQADNAVPHPGIIRRFFSNLFRSRGS